MSDTLSKLQLENMAADAAINLQDKKIVIIADDEKHIRETLATIIKILFDDKVRLLVAHNGMEASMMLDKLQYVLPRDQLQQIVLMTDDHMPHMGGRELIQSVRSKGSSLNNINIILSSGEAAIAGNDVDNIIFLDKPLEVEKMQNCLNHIFDHIDQQKKLKLPASPLKTTIDEQIQKDERFIRFIEAKRDEPRWYAERENDNDNMRQLKKLECAKRSLHEKLTIKGESWGSSVLNSKSGQFKAGPSGIS